MKGVYFLLFVLCGIAVQAKAAENSGEKMDQKDQGWFKSKLNEWTMDNSILYRPSLRSGRYQRMTGAEKLATIRGKCFAASELEHAGWWTQAYQAAKLQETASCCMKDTFVSESDDMPPQFGLTARKKLLHRYGVVTAVEWIDVGGHNYTGIFKGGCDTGIMRLSLANPPDPRPHIPIIPGVAMKFLRSGVPSGNVFGMYTLHGQQSFNLFEHDLTNHPGSYAEADLTHDLLTLVKLLERASDFPTMLGLHKMAEYNCQGEEPEMPHFPFRLIFHPTDEWHYAFPSRTGDSYSSFVNTKSFEYYLEHDFTALSGSIDPIMYEVYAVDNPEDDLCALDSYEKCPPKLIGKIKLKFSSHGKVDFPRATNYGDSKLFFQHTLMEDDFTIKPTWIKTAKKIIQTQKLTKWAPSKNPEQVGYFHPDLPFGPKPEKAQFTDVWWFNDVEEQETLTEEMRWFRKYPHKAVKFGKKALNTMRDVVLGEDSRVRIAV